MKHSMMVPDWAWRRAQEMSGLRNPASFLRRGLEEWLSTVHATQTGETVTSDSPPYYGSEVPEYTTSFVVQHGGSCGFCKQPIDIGDLAVFQFVGKARRMIHEGCL